MRKATWGVGLAVVMLLASSAMAASDQIPNFTYNPATGNLYVNTDLLSGNSSPFLNGNDGLYTMKIPGPEALLTVPAGTITLQSPKIVWQGDKWTQEYVNGAEQWWNQQSYDDYPVNLNTGGVDLLIATYATGMHTWGTVEYGGVVGGANFTGYTGVEIAGVPEPGTLVLLAAGLFALLAYAWRKRK